MEVELLKLQKTVSFPMSLKLVLYYYSIKLIGKLEIVYYESINRELKRRVRSVKVVYYKSRKRELKMRLMNEKD